MWITHILPPQLLLHDAIPDLPPRHALRELRGLRRVVQDRFPALALRKEGVSVNSVVYDTRV